MHFPARIAVATAVVCTSLFAAGQGSGPGSGAAKGTWKLNVEKSDYGQQPKPKSMRLVVTDDSPASVKWSATGTDGDGKPISESFAGPIDGKQHPVKGDPSVKSVAYTADGNDVKGIVTMSDGSTANETVSMSDSNTMTVKIEGGAPGSHWGTSEVWERVTSSSKKATKASDKKSAS